MAQAYFSLVTNTGKIKIAQSAAGGDAVVITHFAIGDGNGAETNPTAASTALVREVWRTPVESVITDPDNPSAILVTAIIPTNAGGWWMREFGIFDQAGSMIAVAKPVSQYKPTALEGQLEDIRYEFQIIIGENANVTLLVDPSVLFATRAWVESRKVPMGQLMRLPWVPVLSMTLSSAPGNPVVGDTYLVPSNATGPWSANIGKLAEWSGSVWSYIAPPDGHGVSLPDGRVFERIDGAYVEKPALDVQSGKWSYAVAGGTANALTATLNPAPQALTVGMVVVLKIAATNTAAAPTLNVNGMGTATIKRASGQTAAMGDIPVNAFVPFIWDGTNWRISGLSPAHMVPKNILIFGIAGTTDFVVPDGVFSVYAEVYGGGGGGGVQDSGTSVAHGEGGGGGGFAGGWVSVSPGQIIPVTVGNRGVGSGTATGTAGGSSSFGSLLSATGGGAGTNTGAPGIGGMGVGGQINLYGLTGYNGTTQEPAVFARGGDAAGPLGGKAAVSPNNQGTWPGCGGGMVVSGGAVSAVEAQPGGVVVRW